MADYEFIRCVVGSGVASGVIRIAKKHGMLSGVTAQGRDSVYGYLSSSMGTRDNRKEIVSMIIAKEQVSETIKHICRDMKLTRPDFGIAYSMPIDELAVHPKSADAAAETSEVSNYMYQIIYIVVDKGMSEGVIDAAYMAGARGAIIMGAKGATDYGPKKLFSADVAPEKEVVTIIVKSELKSGIVSSIKKSLGPADRDKCVIYVMNINEVYGLHE